MTDEIDPYIVYRLDGDEMECALWQTKEGEMALALFLSGDSALSYRQSANLGADWKIFRPAKPVLLQLLRACNHGGISYAVLDPDREKAKRIFDIAEIAKAAGE